MGVWEGIGENLWMLARCKGGEEKKRKSGRRNVLGREERGYKRMKNGLMRMKTVNYTLENKHFLDYSVTGHHQYTFIDFIFD